MDALSEIFQSISAKSYITTGLSCGDNFSICFPGFDGMKFLFISKGEFYLKLYDEKDWLTLKSGDAVIITRCSSFYISTNTLIKPLSSSEVPYTIKNGLADYGGDSDEIIAGKMGLDSYLSDIILEFLPSIIYIQTGTNSSNTLNWLMKKLHEERLSKFPGSDIVSNYLMQLVMIEGLRNWILSGQSEKRGLLYAMHDRHIFKALTAIHTNPEKEWQVSSLAQIAGMSRSGFINKFKELTQYTPLRYVTRWRIALACKALRSSNESVKNLAYQLGFNSVSVFCTVFRRHTGSSPSEYRRTGVQEQPQTLQSYQGH